MIARIWQGATAGEDGEEYVEFLRKTGFTEYTATPGNRAVLGLRRVRDGRAEFLLLTLWDSEEAIRRFAGPTPERAVFYPGDERYLVERGEAVDHWEVVYQSAAAPPVTARR
jgi:heme-degrading monooxygenase HmoA